MFARASGLGAGAELENPKHMAGGIAGVPSNPFNFSPLIFGCVIGLVPFKILHCNDPSTFSHLMQFPIRYSADLHQGSGCVTARTQTRRWCRFVGPRFARSFVSSFWRVFPSPFRSHFVQNLRQNAK